MVQAVDERLRADACWLYLSGGVDSSRSRPSPAISKGRGDQYLHDSRGSSPELDELEGANLVAAHIQTKPPTFRNFAPPMR